VTRRAKILSALAVLAVLGLLAWFGPRGDFTTNYFPNIFGSVLELTVLAAIVAAVTGQNRRLAKRREAKQLQELRSAAMPLLEEPLARLTDLLQAVTVEASPTAPAHLPATPSALIRGFADALPKLDLTAQPTVVGAEDDRRWAEYLRDEIVAVAENLGRVTTRFKSAFGLDLVTAATSLESDYFLSFLRVVPELVLKSQPPSASITFYYGFLPVAAAEPRDRFLSTVQSLYEAHASLADKPLAPDNLRWDPAIAPFWGASRVT
jgi:hypothetical protein